MNRTMLNMELTDSLMRSFTNDGKRINELPYSEKEVNEIVKMFRRADNRSAIGYFYADATEDSFKANVGQYNYVHIAIHSIINEDRPKLSAIIVSQPLDSFMPVKFII